MTNILIAFADTGGGHRAAATALRDALAVVGRDVTTQLVDPLARAQRFPFRHLGERYARVIEHAPWLWAAGFSATNTPRRERTVQRLAWPLMQQAFLDLAHEHTPDVIVSTHPLLTAPLRRAFPQTPIAVVVTDLISGHVSWYQTGADLLIVPTLQARERAIACGVASERIVVIGVPVATPFIAVPGERAELQERLGWAQRIPTVLLAGGAEGIGAIENLAVAIDRAHLPCDIAVVAGRNAPLAARLRARTWQNSVHVYDFVENFAELIRAAAVLVTKAGPGTISEACASGCPLILSGAIPGQETGNVEFVTKGRAGVWAPSPLAVTSALDAWLVGRDAPAALRRASAAALQLARPHAAREIALSVLRLANTGRGTSVEPPIPVAAAPARLRIAVA